MGRLLEGRAAVGHLLRRVTFGPSPSEMAAWEGVPYEQAVDRLLATLDAAMPADPPGFDVYRPGAIQEAWIARMLGGEGAFAERLALFWHGHFATSDAKLQDSALMWAQHRLFRTQGAGRFADLVLAVSRDVAMIRWLDGNGNRAGHPNENYARELQELFTLGRGRYTEADVREVARAFTGWGSRHHQFVFTPAFHDAGPKSFHGATGALGGEDAVRVLTALPACHRFLADRLLRRFSHPEPTEAEVAELATVLQSSGGDVRAALRSMLLAPAFRDATHHRALVRSPVEFVVAALRATGVTSLPTDAPGWLERMGQTLFRPPSVKGWTSGAGWLSAGGTVERLRAALQIASLATEDAVRDIDRTAFDGEVPPALSDALHPFSGRARVAVVLASPEFQLA